MSYARNIFCDKTGERVLGVPTVSDRIAQMVVKQILDDTLEPIFHIDSYGYRPNKSAHDALAVTRQRCWRYNWGVEFDIRSCFDNISHCLLMKAIDKVPPLPVGQITSIKFAFQVCYYYY